jgi:hypothetical protein
MVSRTCPHRALCVATVSKAGSDSPASGRAQTARRFPWIAAIASATHASRVPNVISNVAETAHVRMECASVYLVAGALCASC